MYSRTLRGLGSEKDAKATAKRINVLDRPPYQDVTTELDDTQDDGAPAAAAEEGTQHLRKRVQRADISFSIYRSIIAR